MDLTTRFILSALTARCPVSLPARSLDQACHSVGSTFQPSHAACLPIAVLGTRFLEPLRWCRHARVQRRRTRESFTLGNLSLEGAASCDRLLGLDPIPAGLQANRRNLNEMRDVGRFVRSCCESAEETLDARVFLFGTA